MRHPKGRGKSSGGKRGGHGGTIPRRRLSQRQRRRQREEVEADAGVWAEAVGEAADMQWESVQGALKRHGGPSVSS
eukprot:5601860-Pleurochrysis_carterae.AAC.1